MNKQRIQFLVISAIIVVTGLIFVQIYWISNAIELKESQFNDNVKQALNNVVTRLEKIETANFISGKRKLIKSNKSSKSGIRQSILISSVDNKVNVRISKNYYNSSKSIKNPDNCETTNHVCIGYESGGCIADTAVHIDSVYNVIYNKTNLIEDVINEMVYANVNLNLNQRLNKNILDSVLNFELNNIGINTKYEYAVFDFMNFPVFGSFENIFGLISTKYSERLYPGDIMLKPYFIKLYFPNQRSYLLGQASLVLILSASLIMLVIFVFFYSIKTIIKQKQLSEIKTDFVNNMTHELKTPISTISIACEALGDPDVSGKESDNNPFVKIIKDENKRLSNMVENILHNAIYEKSKFKLNLESHDIHDILKAAITNIEMQINQRNGKINAEFAAESTILMVDKFHLTNVFTNIFDNANKYSKDSPEIDIKTYNDNKGLYISVKDNGIGISKDNQKRIFEKFYRVPTGDVHDVKGFGLGLSYSFNIILKHLGNINVISEKNKGSEFVIFLPYNTSIEK